MGGRNTVRNCTTLLQNTRPTFISLAPSPRSPPAGPPHQGQDFMTPARLSPSQLASQLACQPAVWPSASRLMGCQFGCLGVQRVHVWPARTQIGLASLGHFWAPGEWRAKVRWKKGVCVRATMRREGGRVLMHSESVYGAPLALARVPACHRTRPAHNTQSLAIPAGCQS